MEDLRWRSGQVNAIAGALVLQVCFKQVVHLPCTTAQVLNVRSFTAPMQP